MERFFSKKSVAFFLTTIILFGFFSLSKTAEAAWNCTGYPYSSSNNTDALPTEVHNINCKAQIENRALNNQEQTRLSAIRQTNQAAVDGATGSWYDAATAVGDTVVKIGALVPSAANWLDGILTLPMFAAIVSFLEIIKTVFSYWLAVAGAIFDISINVSIINIKAFFDNAGVLNSLWTMIRDLFNISFIFLLLYVSISQIVGSMGVKAKTTLTSIIISAVFINFSMFFVKLLIDLGNIVAIAIYNSYGTYSMGLGIVDQSVRFLSELGVITFLKSTLTITGQTNTIAEQVMQLMVMGALMYTYLYGAFLLLGRTIALIFLSVFSPIGFVGSGIPGFGGWSSNWWKALVDQILVAPLMMFLLLVVSRLMENKFLYNIISTNKLTATGIEGPAIDVGGTVYYIIIIMFMLMGMKQVKKLSGAVTEIAIKAIKVTALVGAAVATGGAVVAGTVGAGAAGAAAAAGEAGAGAAGRAAARLAFSAKNVRESGFGKLIEGKYDKTGVGGVVQNFARGQLLGGFKDASGGLVDIDKLQKTLEKNQKENEKTITDKLEKIGPKKAMEEEKQISDTLANIQKQAENRVGEEYKNQEQAKTDHEKAQKEFKEKEKALKDADQGKNPAAFAQADKELKAAKVTLEGSDAKVKEFTEAYEKKMEQQKAEIAAEMGLKTFKNIETGEEISANKALELKLKEQQAKIKEAVKARNEFISDTLENGDFAGTVMFEKDRKELAAKLRAQKVGIGKSAKEQLKEIAKKIEEEEGGGEKKEEKPKEEKPGDKGGEKK